MLNKFSVQVVFDRKKVATRSSAKQSKKGTVDLSVTVNGQRKFISTGIRLYLGQWSGCQVIAHEQAIELNERLNNIQAAVIDIVNKCDRDGCTFCWFMLDSLFARASGGASFTNFVERQIQERPLAHGTAKHHIKVLNFLRANKINDVGQLVPETIQKIDDLLHRRLVNGAPMMQTSIYGYHKVIKSYIHLAVRAGLMKPDQNPYLIFQTQKGQSHERAVLTMDEIHRLSELKTLNIYMQHVRDLFLFQIWTGISVSDMMSMDFMQACQGDIIKGRMSS